LGTPGYLACLIFSLVMAILAQGWRAGLACGLALALAAVFYHAGLKPLLSGRFWLFLGFLLAPAALFLGPGDLSIGDVIVSRQGLAAGVQMGLRAITILVTVTGFAASVSIGELTGLLERAGWKGLGFALGVAVNMLPTIQETATNAYQALRLRGGFRRQRLQAIRLWLITVIVNSLRQAEEIVSAAEARAFSPDRVWLQPITWHWLDGALAITLLLAALVLLLI